MQYYAEKRLTRLVTRYVLKIQEVSATSATSSAHAERLKVELERAALLAKSATLVEKEELELQAGLAATDRRLAVLRKYESSDGSSRTKSTIDVSMSAPRKRDVSHSKSNVASNGTWHSHTTGRGADAIQALVTSVDNSVNTNNLVTVIKE